MKDAFTSQEIESSQFSQTQKQASDRIDAILGQLTFTDEDGDEHTGQVTREFFIGEQKWVSVEDVGIYGVRWLVPQGSPNNATPICEESDPEEYAAIMAQSGAPAGKQKNRR